jgi:rsbT antagonist protein RsbS
MRVPILKQSQYVIASIQSALSDEELLQLRDDLARDVGRYRSRGVIIDVTVLDVMDSFAVRTLRAIAHMIRLRGAETVIVGIQPEVAFAMVQLGLTLEDITTALDLEEGLAFLDRQATAGARAVGMRAAGTRAPGARHVQ